MKDYIPLKILYNRYSISSLEFIHAILWSFGLISFCSRVILDFVAPLLE